MSTERRYTEHEIAAIFKRAAEAQEAVRQGAVDGEGLTLAELQQVGREAGITPAFITRAAAEVDGAEAARPPKRLLGMPISVTHMVELPGAFTDDDWERLVVDARETFRATGEVRSGMPSLREWRNGNLHVLVEPSDEGHRLRLRTLKGNAGPVLYSGLLVAAFGLVMVLSMIVTGDFRWVDDNVIAVLFAVGGLGALGFTARHLSQWREERRSQMEMIAARAVERSGTVADAMLNGGRAAAPLDVPPEPAPAARPQRAERTHANTQ